MQRMMAQARAVVIALFARCAKRFGFSAVGSCNSEAQRIGEIIRSATTRRQRQNP